MARLAELFREHPAWVEAARRVVPGATSRVTFSHRPGEVYSLVREGRETRLVEGDTPDPDFVFHFAPDAVEQLAAVRGGTGDFAVVLFDQILAGAAAGGVDLRILAPFRALVRRGYLRLLLVAGPKVILYGAAHGVRGLTDLRRVVRRVRRVGPGAADAP